MPVTFVNFSLQLCLLPPVDYDVGMDASTAANVSEVRSIQAEQLLVARLQRGEDAAFEQLVREYGPRMLAAVRRFLPQEADRHDALQDALISAFQAIKRFSGNSSLNTWLHRIAVNASLMKLRERRRRPEKPIEDFLPRFLDDGHRDQCRGAWVIQPDSAALSDELREHVQRGIEQLPDSYRLVLQLRDIEQHSTEETARLLETSEANVKTRLHRARQALREILDQTLGVGRE